MKTSNKLLLGLLVVTLTAILSVMIIAKVSSEHFDFDLSGVNITVDEPIEAFSELQISGILGVYFTQGDTVSMRMEGDSTLISMIEIGQSGDKLSLKLEGKNVKKRVSIFIQNPELEDLKVIAGSRFVTENKLNVNSLDVEVVAGGNAEINGSFNTLAASITAGGRASLSGDAARTRIQGTAGGILNAYDLESRYCKADAVAGAIVEVFVTDELKASATAGGIIRYKGSPQLKDVNVSAGGRLKNKD